ncbi:hypothetical protein O3P69_008371 [Scylla paramamosain]|uniref:Aquaporin n=1 Tax=Scylla paramamosain TaxID=85552 RepID=A0AAW0SJB5_SCYPA
MYINDETQTQQLEERRTYLSSLFSTPDGEEMSIVVTTLTIATQLWMSHIVRDFLSGKVGNQLLKGCLLELVACAEMCGVSYELAFVNRLFGIWAWSLCVFLLILWRERSWGATTACPYMLLEQYVEAGANPLHVFLKILAQITGAVISCRWVKRLWAMEEEMQVPECSTDLQVPVVIGFLIEAVLTCVSRLCSRTLGELRPKYASVIDSLFTTALVILAFDYSGGYFNPVLATGLKWNCQGHTNTEYIVVYWAGSILGAMLSLRLWTVPYVRATLLAPFQTKSKSQ